MLAYTGDGADGIIKTFTIDGSYNITQTYSLTHDATRAQYSSLVQLDATHYMLAYGENDTYDGWVKTFSIDGSYNIAEIDSLEHETAGAEGFGVNSLVKIDATHSMLAYAGSNEDGYLKIFTLDGSYDITETSSLEHDTTTVNYNSLVKIDATHFILAYMGADNDGFIKMKTVKETRY